MSKLTTDRYERQRIWHAVVTCSIRRLLFGILDTVSNDPSQSQCAERKHNTYPYEALGKITPIWTGYRRSSVCCTEQDLSELSYAKTSDRRLYRWSRHCFGMVRCNKLSKALRVVGMDLGSGVGQVFQD